MFKDVHGSPARKGKFTQTPRSTRSSSKCEQRQDSVDGAGKRIPFSRSGSEPTLVCEVLLAVYTRASEA